MVTSGGPGFRRGGGNPNDTVPVLAIAARLADVPVYLDGVGTAKALNTVLVRSQVDGKLMKIDFKEGQEVAQGSVITSIAGVRVNDVTEVQRIINDVPPDRIALEVAGRQEVIASTIAAE